MAKLNSKTKYFWFFLLFLLLVVIIIRANQEKPPANNIIHEVSSPVAKFFSAVGFWCSEKIDFIFSIGSLKKENEQLLKENVRLKFTLADYKDIEKENEQLRRELNLKSRVDHQMEPALVIGEDINNRSEMIIIDKGSRDGLWEGAPVLLEKGILIGQIKRIYSNQSEVELILSQRKNINAEIEESSERGIVHGEYGTSVVMDMISQTVEIKKGDTVITSGLSDNIPRGLLIGYVEEVTPAADQLFQKASLNLPLDLNKIRLVWVIKDKKNE